LLVSSEIFDMSREVLVIYWKICTKYCR